jgi:hypothetical protein
MEVTSSSVPPTSSFVSLSFDAFRASSKQTKDKAAPCFAFVPFNVQLIKINIAKTVLTKDFKFN